MESSVEPFSALGALPFRQFDAARRLMGTFLDASGLGPREVPFRIAAKMHGARLRAYQDGNNGRGPSLLVVPAPFKRPYIWDLRPAISVIRRLRRAGLSIYLLEWGDPAANGLDCGLSDYVDRLPVTAIRAIAAETGRDKLVLVGHSLGGTFAAICAALHPVNVIGLLLIETPLSFADRGAALTHAVVAAPPAQTILSIVGSPVPGSVINLMSALAAPNDFYWRPMVDALASADDAEALAIHAGVRRWTLDEVAMPGRLFVEVVEWLYREDRLTRGELQLGGHRVSLDRIRARVLAVVNPDGRVVPPGSTLDGLGATRTRADILHCPAETGTMLEHVTALVGPNAHAELWPRIVTWLRTFA